MTGYWSEEEKDTFRGMISEGATYEDIAEVLNRSMQSLYHKAHKMGIQAHRKPVPSEWSEDDLETFQRMIEEGATYEAIGQAINRPKGGVAQKARKINIRSKRSLQIEENQKLKQQGQKRCSQCKQVLPLDEFYTAGWGYCKSCEKFKVAEYDGSSVRRRLRERFRSARARAARKGVVFEISFPWLIGLWERQGAQCYYTGRQMTLNGDYRFSVSMDRIDPPKGYVKDNTVLCCSIVNRMKSDQSIEELKDWCRAILSFKGETRPDCLGS